MNFTDNEIEEFFKGIFAGDITKENLPVDLYQSIAEFLEKGLLSGAGGTLASFDGKDLDLIQELRTNIYMFSAAKTYQEVRGMTDLLYNEDNKVKPFDEFFEDARSLYNNYNVNYAQTEYNTAVASGQMGIRWNQIQADREILPLLKMTVVEDAQTTEICEPLDGITLPVGDPFWDEFYPPNHWNCRSTVLQLDEGDISSKADVDKAKEHAEEDMQDVFKMNVGKDEIAFSPDHPYFKVPREDKELAKDNFGLPMPQDLVNYTKSQTIQERIEEIKTKAKELSDQIAEKQRIFDEKIKPLKDQMDKAVEKVNTSRQLQYELADKERIWKEYETAKAAWNEVYLTRWKVREGYNEAVSDLLASNYGEAKYKFNATKAQFNKIASAQPGQKAFGKIVGDNLLKAENEVNIKVASTRECYGSATKTIKIGAKTTVSTVTHELGHFLEDVNKDYFEKIKAFYATRTAGEAEIKLNKLFPRIGYGSDEITKKDKFMEAYTGKVYVSRINGQQRATEITSMWFTHVFDDLHKFIKEDPDHFEFIFKLFNK